MYLVDGNNVMGQRVGWHRDRPAARTRLLRELATLSRTGHAVSVVFDGRPPDGWPDGDSVDGVAVYFARPGSNADDRMVELAEETGLSEAIVAVTSDRDLTSRLLTLGVESVRSGQFRQRLDVLCR